MAALSANAAPAMQILQSAGVSKAGAAALVGNWQQESGVNPADAGGGLAQWQGARASGLQQYAASTGQHPLALPTQIGYAVHELKSGYPQLFAALQKGGDPGRLALAVSQQYERPGDPMNGNRVAYAQAAFQLGGQPKGPVGFGPTAVPNAQPGRNPNITSSLPKVTVTPQQAAQATTQQNRAEALRTLLPAIQAGGGIDPLNISLLGGAATKQIGAAKQVLSTQSKQQNARFQAERQQFLSPQHSSTLDAQRNLQELAGTTPLAIHPATGAGTVGTGGNKIVAMTKMANALVGKPYVWGGGHSAWGPQSGYDCSGFVSAVLHAAGYLQAPQTTQTLPSQPEIANGPGRFVTVYDRTDGGAPGNDHVIIDLNGSWYESGGNAQFNPGGGVAKIPKPDAAYLSSFNRQLHPLGL